MATWAYPVSMHPWFRMPSNKRKTSDLDSSDSSDFENFSFPAKRRRCDALESGFAQLSLNPALHAAQLPKVPFSAYSSYPGSQVRGGGPPAPPQPPTFGDWAAYTHSSVHCATPGIAQIVLPGSVEEPASPAAVSDVPEVTMKSRSWYELEKDRIVIVDLDDSDVDEPTDEPAVQVNSALLDRLRSRREPDFQADLAPSDSSKALVLFKPVLPPPPENTSKVEEESQVTEIESSSSSVDDQSMQDDELTDIIVDVVPIDDDDAMEVEEI